MNKNKIIFWTIWVLLLALILWGVSLLNKSTDQIKNPKNTAVWAVNIWILDDNKTKFNDIINDFKAKNKSFATTTINIESFSNYADYYNTLSTSFIVGKSPDVFVLNNNEEPIFLEQVDAISPTEIDPNNFRKWFLQFFWDDLIQSAPITTEQGEKKVEFLVWIPAGYETLWLFYNRRYVQAKDVTSWAAINSVIKTIKEKNSDVTPIALWNGSTVPYAADIITQFFLLDGLTGLDKTEGNKMKQGLSSFMVFWDEAGDNAYNKKIPELREKWKNALDLFATDEVSMVAGYPRMLQEVAKRWFKKSFLSVAPFPNYFLSDGKTLVNYNYFVVNKNSRAIKVGQAFIKYLASEAGQKKYLETFPYYLPAQIALESERLWEKVDPNYSVVLKDFVRDDTVKSSYNKWLKALYDEEITRVLDDSENYIAWFEKMKKTLVCKILKITKFQNLSSDCN